MPTSARRIRLGRRDDGDPGLRRPARRPGRLRPQRRPGRPGARRRRPAAHRPAGRRRSSAWSPRCRCAGGSSCRSAGSPRSTPTRSCSAPARSTCAASRSARASCSCSRTCSTGGSRSCRDGRAGDRGRRRDGARPHRRLVAGPGRGPRAHRPAHPPRPAAPARVGRGARADRRRRHTRAPPALLAVLEDMRPADLANALQDLPDARRNEVAAALDDERLADVLEELPEHDQVEILAALDRERAADVLEEMDPDDAADLLAELPEPEQEVLLDLMEPDEADAGAASCCAYPPGTAGSVMTSEPVILHAGRDGRRGAGPHPRAAAAAGRRRAGVRGPRRRWPRRPAATSASCTSSGCCASRRRRCSAAWSTTTSTRCARTPRWPRSPSGWRRTTWSAMPVVDDNGPAGRRGHRRRRPRPPAAARLARPRHAPVPPSRDLGRPPMAEPRRAGASTSRASPGRITLPRFDPEAFGRLVGGHRPVHGHGEVPRLHDRVHPALDRLEHARAGGLRFDPYTFTFLTLILSLQASYAAPLILLAQNRQADRDRLTHGGGPAAGGRCRRPTPSTWPGRSPRCGSRSARWPPATSCARSWPGWPRSSTTRRSRRQRKERRRARSWRKDDRRRCDGDRADRTPTTVAPARLTGPGARLRRPTARAAGRPASGRRT